MLIAVVGKGGVGKTTVTSLLLRRLLDGGQAPVLAVDADPSNCLGPVLGLSITRTLAQLRDDLRTNAGDRPPSMSKADWLALGAEDALVEQAGFDLLTMGHPEGPGCYCFVNNLIRNHLDRLTRTYRHVLVDCEAGLEHLSRRTSGKPDRLVCVANGSRMSQETVDRALAVYRDLHGALPSKVDLVLNGLGSADFERRKFAVGSLFSTVVHLPWDRAVAELDAAGCSLLGLDAASPAVQAFARWDVAS